MSTQYVTNIQLSNMSTHDELAGAETSDKKKGRKRKACQYGTEAGDMALGTDLGESRAPDAATRLADGPRTQAEEEQLEESVPAQPNEAAPEQGTCQPIDPGTEHGASATGSCVSVCSWTLSFLRVPDGISVVSTLLFFDCLICLYLLCSALFFSICSWAAQSPLQHLSVTNRDTHGLQ